MGSNADPVSAGPAELVDAGPDASEPAPVVPAEGDLTLVSLAEGDELPAPLLELEPSEISALAVHPGQLEVLTEPAASAPAEPAEAATLRADEDEDEIPTAPEPAAYDLDDLPPGPAADATHDGEAHTASDVGAAADAHGADTDTEEAAASEAHTASDAEAEAHTDVDTDADADREPVEVSAAANARRGPRPLRPTDW